MRFMRWTEARKLNICSNCGKDIKPKEMYLSSNYSAFCKICGKKYNKGELNRDSKMNPAKLDEMKREIDSLGD